MLFPAPRVEFTAGPLKETRLFSLNLPGKRGLVAVIVLIPVAGSLGPTLASPIIKSFI